MKPKALGSRIRTALAVLALAGLALIVIGAVHASDTGWWSATEFQVVNLDPAPAYITARFIDMGGTTVYTLTGTIPPLGTRFYQPELMEPPLPADFAGMLTIDSKHNVAATILHRDGAGGSALLPIQGNTTFEVVDDGQLGNVAQIPVDLCTIVLVHNPGQVETLGSMDILGEAGAVLLSQPLDLLPDTSASYVLATLLPSLLSGGAVIEADHPIEVTIIHNCLALPGAGSYVAPAAASHHWTAPWVMGGGIGHNGSSVISVKNAGSLPATVDLLGPSGPPDTYVLLPQGSVQAPVSFDVDGPVWISSTQPVTAKVMTRYTILDKAQQPAGLYTYGAFDPARATTHVALPMLLGGYEGWDHGDGVYIQNVGAISTTVTLRYVTDDGQVLIEQAVVEPGYVWQPPPLAPGYAHAAATARADQPLVALVTAHKEGSQDNWVAYRGINYVPRRLYLLYLPISLKTQP